MKGVYIDGTRYIPIDDIGKIMEEIESAIDAAGLDNASFSFSHESIIIGETHFPDDAYRKGSEMNPDVYIKDKVSLHHSSWIIRPLKRAKATLSDLLSGGESL